MKEGDRPDPEELLGRLKAEAAREGKGSLKIFFGMAPGVGKTYAMLETAQRLKREGVDVVVGCIEAHGRKETAALVGNLEVLSMKDVGYKGAILKEFDLEGAIQRHPKVLLLDELAHTNAPGSVHKKRWQDVMDLLDTGIDVHTTLNVQHIESLNDVVKEVTGIRVRETVPDAALERADEIELVDLPPDELLQRLGEGKVYVPEQAARAKERFFRRGNLLALRELALRHTAQHVDADVQQYRREHAIDKTWASGERILVAVGPAPASAGLVRAARRMADRLRAPWIAAAVESPSAAGLPPAAKARLDANLALASDLGAEVVRLTGDRVSEALISYAKKQNVTRVVIGKPTHSKLRDFVRGSLLDEVVRGSANIDVLVTNGSESDETRPQAAEAAPRAEGSTANLAPYGAALLAVVIATAIGAFVRTLLDLPDVVMLYLIAIVGVAVRYTRGPSVLAAALSVLAFDFFFVPPFYTLNVSDTRHFLTFAMMFIVGLLISGLMLRIRRQELSARLREERTAMLYALTRALGGAATLEEISFVIANKVEQIFECDVAVRLADASSIESTGAGRAELEPQEVTVARWVFEHGKPAGLGTDTLAGAKVFVAPLVASTATRGVVALRPPKSGSMLDREQRSLLDALLRQGALALERTHLADEARAAAVRAKTEELRASLLSAVSHDLRTPLAAITGAATALLDPESRIAERERNELLTAICDEAERLERLVGNLLDMTRLESGGITVKREWVPLEEIVGSAVNRLEKKLKGRLLTTELPADLPLLPVDPVVFEQVFVNLLENAAKHTSPDAAITISARAEDSRVIIDVSDRGPGVPEGLASKVFDKFYRGPWTTTHGVGLGLTIVRGIVEAHGGTISVLNRHGGGATFRISLPVEGEAPPIPAEPPVSSRRGEVHP